MTNMPINHFRDDANSVFAQLNPQHVEQFYAGYQLWTLQQRMAEVQAQIAVLTQQLVENTAHLQRVQPSAIALAALARLQSNGVSDITLLDRLLERGEEWLDRIMQRLTYCEKFDFIRGNYTDWCEHALEGAYDWIDSVEEINAKDVSTPSPLSSSSISTSESDTSNAMQNQTTEELLLQKLMSEEHENNLYAPTVKIPVITLTHTQTIGDASQQAQSNASSPAEISSTEHSEQTEQPANPIDQTHREDHIAALEEVIPGEEDQVPIMQPVTPVAEEVILSENEQMAATQSTTQPVVSAQAAYIPLTDESLVEPVQSEYIPLTDEGLVTASEEPLAEPVQPEDITPPNEEETGANEQVLEEEILPQMQSHQDTDSNGDADADTLPTPKRSLTRRLFAAYFSRR